MIFIDNKYYRWYNDVVIKAKDRSYQIKTYTERHHIIPRSFGGSNKKQNIVRLTAREHFICHWLLIKCTTGEYRNKMIKALHIMQGKNSIQDRYTSNITSKVYSKIRKEYSKLVSQTMKSRVRGAPWNKGKIVGPHSIESNELRSKALKGRFTGENNSSAKTYKITSPDGKIFIVTGQFKKFCLEHNLSCDTLRRSLNSGRKTYNGWLAEYF